MYCVYLFQHKQNHKIYIGRAKDFQKRLGTHLRTSKSVHVHKTYFHLALAKYGLDAFNYFIIEEFDRFQDCCEAEAFWVAYFQSNKKGIGYNLSEGGETNTGVSPSPETRKRLSESGKKAYDEGRRSTPVISPEHLQKMIANQPRGSNHHNTNLTEEIVADIKGLLLSGATPKYIRQKYNLSKMVVLHIKSGRTWSYVQPIIPTNLTDNIKPPNKVLKGSANANSKLAETQVRNIKKMLSEEYKISDIARMFSVSWSLIKGIKTGKSWAHIS